MYFTLHAPLPPCVMSICCKDLTMRLSLIFSLLTACLPSTEFRISLDLSILHLADFSHSRPRLLHPSSVHDLLCLVLLRLSSGPHSVTLFINLLSFALFIRLYQIDHFSSMYFITFFFTFILFRISSFLKFSCRNTT